MFSVNRRVRSGGNLSCIWQRCRKVRCEMQKARIKRRDIKQKRRTKARKEAGTKGRTKEDNSQTLVGILNLLDSELASLDRYTTN